MDPGLLLYMPMRLQAQRLASTGRFGLITISDLRLPIWPSALILVAINGCPSHRVLDLLPSVNIHTNTTCRAVWFKVQEEGRQGTSDVWASDALQKPGAAVKYTIPKCIPSGYYLVRHEIIALQTADQYRGAQFYPSCHQLKVSGGGRILPSGLVSFPGAYKPTDDGITYDAYKGMQRTWMRFEERSG